MAQELAKEVLPMDAVLWNSSSSTFKHTWLRIEKRELAETNKKTTKTIFFNSKQRIKMISLYLGSTQSQFILGGSSNITADGDCSHEIKRHLLLGRKVMTNLDSTLKSWDITLPTKVHLVSSVQFSWVTQSCLTVCYPMNRSTPDLPVHHQLPESTQTQVHWVGDAIQPSHPVIPFSSHLQSILTSGSFQMSQFFAQDGQGIGVSALHQSLQWIFRTDLL